MRWTNHQITAASLTFAGTGNLTATCLAWIGSTFPDVIELPFGSLVKHRSWSHWPYPYFTIFIALWGFAWTSDGFVSEYIAYFFLGCLLHLATDALSPRGIPLGRSPYGDRQGLGVYIPFRESEYVVALSIVVCALFLAKLRGFFSADYLALEIERVSLLIKLLE